MALPNKRFYSRLFQRYVEPNELYYWKFIYAELLYRIEDSEEKNCSCIQCQTELNNYKNYLDKLKNRKAVHP